MGDRAKRTNDLIPKILAARDPDKDGLVVRPGEDGKSFTMNGKRYEIKEKTVPVVDRAFHVSDQISYSPAVPSHWQSSSVSAMPHPLPEVALREAIRKALSSGMSNDKIAEIFRLEQISVVMDS